MNPIASTLSPILPQAGALASKDPQAYQQNLEAVGKEVESLFLSMMLKEMRNSLEEGLFGGEGSDTYGSMFDMFIGRHLAESSPLGLGDIMLQQYAKNKQDSDSSGGDGTTDEAKVPVPEIRISTTA